MRDLHDNVVIVCSIENVDPMGVHTGDSVTVAPQQTLTDRLYQRLRDQAIAVIRAVGVETGGSNVQFAVDPVSEEILVIEMNPRVSRSSALASKATGFPIAKIAARLAVGYALEEIPNDITADHARELRADDRLRGRQVAALRLREVPRRGPRPVDAHEVGGRGDGDRAHLPAGLRQGAAQPRARHRHQARRRRHADAARDARAPGERPLRRRCSRPSARARASTTSASARPSTRGSWRSCARWPSTPTPRWPASARTSPSTPAPPSSRRARRTTTRAGSAAPPTRSSAASARAWSSSAAGPTASARASSSTTAACTRP